MNELFIESSPSCSWTT